MNNNQPTHAITFGMAIRLAAGVPATFREVREDALTINSILRVELMVDEHRIAVLSEEVEPMVVPEKQWLWLSDVFSFREGEHKVVAPYEKALHVARFTPWDETRVSSVYWEAFEGEPWIYDSIKDYHWQLRAKPKSSPIARQDLGMAYNKSLGRI